MFPIDTIKVRLAVSWRSLDPVAYWSDRRGVDVCRNSADGRLFAASQTHIQAAGGSKEGIQHLLREGGYLRLWRGCSTMLFGCIPSHAAYFSIYEAAKESSGANQPGHHPVTSQPCVPLCSSGQDPAPSMLTSFWELGRPWDETCEGFLTSSCGSHG